jgi:methyltransferase (TIGR00027 family)
MRADQPSATAKLIARCILLSARSPRLQPLVAPGEPEALTRILAACGPAGWFEFSANQACARWLLFKLERFLLPGVITHYLARKRWLEAAVRAALGRGVRQVVVLGAGFDTLACRLQAERPDVRFIELDHPATQTPKRTALGGATALTFLAADLATDSPADVLRACPAFAANQPTLFIAEGLLMYFPEKRVAELLGGLASITRPPAEVLFSFMARAPDGSIGFRGEHAAIGWWLRRGREPFQWGVAREALPVFLQACGLRIQAVADHDTLRAEVLLPRARAELPLARGECLCHCSTVAP